MVGLLMPPKHAESKDAGRKVSRKTASVQIDGDLARMVAVVASHRRISQAELVSPVAMNRHRAAMLAEGRDLRRGPVFVGKRGGRVGGVGGAWVRFSPRFSRRFQRVRQFFSELWPQYLTLWPQRLRYVRGTASTPRR